MAINVPDAALIVAWRERGRFQIRQVDAAREVTRHLRRLATSTEEALDGMQRRPYSIEADIEIDEYFSA